MTFDTRPPLPSGVQSPGAPFRAIVLSGFRPGSQNTTRARRAGEHYVTPNKPQILLLTLSVAAALAACKREPAAEQAAAPEAKPAEAMALTLDESKLPPVNRFQLADLDSSKNACTDFNGYVNSKWLAANPIPVRVHSAEPRLFPSMSRSARIAAPVTSNLVTNDTSGISSSSASIGPICAES